jgi:DNA adenine methylase
VQTFVRWAGSKRSLIGELASYWSKDAKRYVEPFAGSACLFFHLEPKAALISDLNGELISMYRELQRDVELVLECFRRLRRGEKAYYAIRRKDPNAMSKPEAAARFLYLNRYCFNGLFRTNQAGTFNVPYGPPKRPLKWFEDRVREAARQIKHVEFRVSDFGPILSDVRKGDFVYLDPPYVVDERRIFSEYLPGSFAKEDLDRLAEGLVTIDDAGASFLLSYADSREARLLAKKWSKRTVSTRRNIAGFVGARKVAGELLVTNVRA